MDSSFTTRTRPGSACSFITERISCTLQFSCSIRDETEEEEYVFNIVY